MKKTILLPLILLIFCSCNNDDLNYTTDENLEKPELFRIISTYTMTEENETINSISKIYFQENKPIVDSTFDDTNVFLGKFQYEYNEQGLLIKDKNDCFMEYDDLGRLTQVVQQFEGHPYPNYTMTFQYYDNRITQIVEMFSQPIIRHYYLNQNGLIKNLVHSDYNKHITYDNDNIKQISYTFEGSTSEIDFTYQNSPSVNRPSFNIKLNMYGSLNNLILKEELDSPRPYFYENSNYLTRVNNGSSVFNFNYSFDNNGLLIESVTDFDSGSPSETYILIT